MTVHRENNSVNREEKIGRELTQQGS